MGKQVLLVIFIVLMCSAVYAAEITTCGEISGDTYFNLTTDLDNVSDWNDHFDWTCIVIETNDTVIDCQGHTIRGNGSAEAFALIDNHNVTIKNCVIRNVTKPFNIGSSDEITVMSNDMRHFTSTQVIRWANTSNSYFIGNTLDLDFAEQTNGVDMTDSYFNLFMDNTFLNLNNYSYAAILVGNPGMPSDFNNFTANNFSQTTVGIMLSDAQNTMISENTFEGTMEIDVRPGMDQNIIFNNTFTQNFSVQDEAGSSWNSSTIGNHWRQYDEESEGCYDDSPVDGFCDEPYPLRGGLATDYLPIYMGSADIFTDVWNSTKEVSYQEPLVINFTATADGSSNISMLGFEVFRDSDNLSVYATGKMSDSPAANFSGSWDGESIQYNGHNVTYVITSSGEDGMISWKAVGIDGYVGKDEFFKRYRINLSDRWCELFC